MMMMMMMMKNVLYRSHSSSLLHVSPTYLARRVMGLHSLRLSAASVIPIAAPGVQRASFAWGKKIQRQNVVAVSKSTKKKGGIMTWCTGCGAVMGGENPIGRNQNGMAEAGQRDVSRSRRQKEKYLKNKLPSVNQNRLCTRCSALNESQRQYSDGEVNDDEYLASLRRLALFGENNKKVEGKAVVASEVFQTEVSKIKASQFSMVIHVVDATDFEGTLIRSLRGMVGKAPLLLVVTKCDLLPENMLDLFGQTHDNEEPSKYGGHIEIITSPIQRRLKWYFNQRMQKKGMRAIETYLLSGTAEQSLPVIHQLANYVYENVNGRNVFVVGRANVGKSTLTNVLSKVLLNRNRFRGKRDRHREDILNTEVAKSTVSALPGTTLMSKRIPCFKSHRHALFDTPGLFAPTSQYKWGVDPIWHALEPQILKPQKCYLTGQVTRLGITNKVPLMLEVSFPEPPSRPAQCVWYTNWHPSANIRSRNIPDGVDVEAPPGVTMKMIQDFNVPLDETSHNPSHSTDVCVVGLGWWAIESDDPFVVRVSGPTSALVNVRQCMFSPRLCRRQESTVETRKSAANESGEAIPDLPGEPSTKSRSARAY